MSDLAPWIAMYSVGFLINSGHDWRKAALWPVLGACMLLIVVVGLCLEFHAWVERWYGCGGRDESER